MKRKVTTLFLLVTGLCLAGQVQGQATITVTSSADDLIPNDNCTLREAVEAANTDSEVDACMAGNGADTIDLNTNNIDEIRLTIGKLSVDGNLEIQGDFSDRSLPYTTLNGNNDHRIIEVTEGSNITLNSLVMIFGGDAAIYSGNATLTLEKCDIYSSKGGRAGGIVAIDGVLNMMGGEIAGNEGINFSGAGAIYASGTQLTIEDARFYANTNEDAGGMEISGSDVVIRNSSIDDNTGPGIAANSGGASLTVSGSSINGNTGYGIDLANNTLRSSDDNISIERTVIYANDQSGIIYAQDGNLEIANSTISNNAFESDEPTAGGVELRGYDGTAQIKNSTVARNANAGVSNSIAGDVSVTLFSSLVAENANSDLRGEISSEGYNLIGTNAGRNDFTPSVGDQVGTEGDELDAGIKEIFFYPDDVSVLSHALTSVSPAIDAGSCPDLEMDARGYGNVETNQRAVDESGIDNYDDGCDVGAFEYGASYLQTAVVRSTSTPKSSMTAAYPNPFSSQATFSVTVQKAQSVRVDLFDALGRRVKAWNERILTPGTKHRFTIDGDNLPSGVYIYRVSSEAFAKSGSVVLTK